MSEKNRFYGAFLGSFIDLSTIDRDSALSILRAQSLQTQQLHAQRPPQIANISLGVLQLLCDLSRIGLVNYPDNDITIVLAHLTHGCIKGLYKDKLLTPRYFAELSISDSTREMVNGKFRHPPDIFEVTTLTPVDILHLVLYHFYKFDTFTEGLNAIRRYNNHEVISAYCQLAGSYYGATCIDIYENQPVMPPLYLIDDLYERYRTT